jgi:hypothetical protein
VKYFIKRYCLLVIAQTACLALGLWLEQRFILSSVLCDSLHNAAASERAAADTALGASAGNAAVDSDGKVDPETRAIEVRAMAFVWITENRFRTRNA